MSNSIREMNSYLLRGFCCEIQRNKHVTQFHKLHWTPEKFVFKDVGAELKPGKYTITVYSRGSEVMCTNLSITSVQTIFGIWVGGLNPQKPHGEKGMHIYLGKKESLIEKSKL